MKKEKVAEYHEATINASLLKLGITPDESHTIEQRARQISVEVAKTPKAKLVSCTFCHHDSDKRFKVCPFCGDNQVEIEKNLAIEDERRLKREEKMAVKTAERDAQKQVKSEALVVAISKYTEKDLDETVARINELASATQTSLWNYADAIRVAYDSQIWRLRSSEGRSVYATDASFSAFARNELGISVQYAYRLMDIAKAYTPEEAKKVGPTKLALILTAPEPVRGELLDKAKDGASVSEIKEEVVEAQKKHGKPDRNKESGRKKLSDKQKEKVAKPKNPRRVVVSDIEGKKRVALITKDSINSDTPRAATSMRDNPIGVLQLLNNVFMTFALTTNSQGEYLLIIDTKREDV